MFRRVALAAVIASVGVIAGQTTAPASPPASPPTGTITCSQHLTQSSYSHPLSAAAVVGPFATTERGLFSNCVQPGNTGDVIIGGTYVYTLHSPNGPRTCQAAATTSTYVGGAVSGRITWWAIDPTTGERHTYTSTSTQLNFVTNDGQIPTTVTVQFKLAGLYAGSTITADGTVFQPAANQFFTDCTSANNALHGSALSGGTLHVP